MNKGFNKVIYVALACTALAVTGCKLPADAVQRTENKSVPGEYAKGTAQDTINTGKVKWKEFFKDENLTALINTALTNNQELNITLQEIQISKNEIKARKGE
ncbi:MAG: RND transporter, partial [Flavobacterium psychrophilum]